MANRRSQVSDELVAQRGYRITGRVQRVAFRAWTREVAEEIGLTGTVRNRPDGSVEVHAAGSVAQLDKLLAHLWEGPWASRVDEVEVIESRKELPDNSFLILY
ncbi:acylphosphatase [Gemmatimonadota bacterium]